MTRPRTTKRVPLAAAALLGLLTLSVLVRWWAGSRMAGLWIAPDEMIYGTLGRSLWEHGELRLYGGATAVYSLVYPALAGLPLALLGPESGYGALKPLQAVAMSLAAVPVFLWARRLAGPGWALAAAALTLAAPQLVYSGLVMTEVAFYPLVVLAAWATAEALERPTLARQGLVVAAVLLAAATRLQALVLVPALATTVLLHAVLERDPRRPLRLWPLAAGLGALALLWAGVRIGTSGEWTAVLGSYAAVAESTYTLGAGARYVAYHAGGLALVAAVFPVCALLLLVWEGARGRLPGPAHRAYVAAALSFAAWFVGLVGVFASAHVYRFAERDLGGLLPVLFVGLAAWVGAGAPRPWRATATAAGLVLAAVLAFPLRDFVVREAVPDSFSLVPLLHLRDRAGETALELAVWLGAAAALALFALLPRRLLPLLPAVGVAALALASVSAGRQVERSIDFDHRYLLGGDRSWVDRAVREDVALIYSGERYWNGVWQTLFWNETVDAAYRLPGAPEIPGLEAQLLAVDADGTLRRADGGPLEERFVVTSNRVPVFGEPVTSIAQQYTEQGGQTLWQVAGPARLSHRLLGVRDDGDMHEPARMQVWDCGGGRLELTLLPKASRVIELRVNGDVVDVLRPTGEEEWLDVVVPAPPDADRCFFEIVPDSLLGSTRIEFVRP